MAWLVTPSIAHHGLLNALQPPPPSQPCQKRDELIGCISGADKSQPRDCPDQWAVLRLFGLAPGIAETSCRPIFCTLEQGTIAAPAGQGLSIEMGHCGEPTSQPKPSQNYPRRSKHTQDYSNLPIAYSNLPKPTSIALTLGCPIPLT